MPRHSKSKRLSGPGGDLCSKRIGPDAPRFPMVADPAPIESEAAARLSRPAVSVGERVAARTGLSPEEVERQMQMHGFQLRSSASS